MVSITGQGKQDVFLSHQPRPFIANTQLTYRSYIELNAETRTCFRERGRGKDIALSQRFFPPYKSIKTLNLGKHSDPEPEKTIRGEGRLERYGYLSSQRKRNTSRPKMGSEIFDNERLKLVQLEPVENTIALQNKRPKRRKEILNRLLSVKKILPGRPLRLLNTHLRSKLQCSLY